MESFDKVLALTLVLFLFLLFQKSEAHVGLAILLVVKLDFLIFAIESPRRSHLITLNRTDNLVVGSGGQAFGGRTGQLCDTSHWLCHNTHQALASSFEKTADATFLSTFHRLCHDTSDASKQRLPEGLTALCHSVDGSRRLF